MISLRKHLDRAGEERAYAALHRVTSLLLEGIAVHAVSCGNTELGLFQATIRRLAASFSAAATDSTDLLLIGGSVIQAIQEYNEGVRRRFAAEEREFHGIAALLTSALASGFRGSERAIHNLKTIEKRLDHASQLEDLRTIKLSLEECLTSVQAEANEHMTRSKNAREAFQAATSSPSVIRAMEAADCDPSTGLPTRPQAIQAMAAALSSRASRFAAVLVAPRLPAINDRFGPSVGDQVLLMVCQSIAQRLRPGEELFRWNSHSFLTLLDRDTPADTVRREVVRWTGSRFEYTVELSGRTVMLSLSLTSMVLPVWESGDIDSLVADIDAFILKSASSGA